MKVAVSQEALGIRFVFTTEKEDPLTDGSATFAADNALIATDILLETLHPDVVGLIALLMVGEFSGDIVLDRAVSTKFATAALDYRKGKSFGPASADVSPRLRAKAWVPALSFSGGVDSYAALQLLPENAECYFLASFSEKDGRKHPKSSESGSRACRELRDMDRTAFEVRSDLEFIRSKVGLPDHLACAVPILIHADNRALGSVTFGSIAEAAYRTGVTTYTELSMRHAYRKIHDIFAAIDLPVHNVVVGLSEVVTTKIVSSSKYAGRSQSCMWGGETPCGECIKCVRKSLLEMANSDRWEAPDIIKQMLSGAKAYKAISAVPMKLENIFAYVAWKCPHQEQFIDLWRKRVRADRYDMTWMEKVFPSSLNYMVEELRADAVSRLAPYAEFMTKADIDNAIAFDLRDVVKDEAAMLANTSFQRAIKG